MNTEILQPFIEGLLVIQPRVFHDERGYFFETWKKNNYQDLGIREHFIQDNVSFSKKNVLRGLHFQSPDAQGKLVTVLQGEVYDVAVDLRKGSDTFGKWFGIVLSQKNKTQFYIPAGFAHGFVVMSDEALFLYKCTAYYNPKAEHTLLWDDPTLNIEWGVENPIVSEKDRKGLKFLELSFL